MESKRGKRAQVTIFIIIAIAIVAVLIIIFSGRIKTLVYGEVPQDYLQGCIEEPAIEALERISLQGGSLAPENYYLYQDDKIGYLCYTGEYGKKCVMQKPFLKQEIEQELVKELSPKINLCLQSLKEQMESRGESFSFTKADTSVSIIPNAVIVSVETDISAAVETASVLKNFRVDLPSQSYNLIMLSSSIANWEARYGDADSLTYMMYYPDIQVLKLKQGDGTAVYILTDRNTQDKLQFASRSMVMPAGYL